MKTDADYRTRIRQLLDDGPTSHRIAPDMLENQVDGTKVAFFLSTGKVVAGSLKVSVDGGVITATGVTEDDDENGFFHLAAAPQFTLSAFYNYNFFNDAEIDEFRNAGLSKISIASDDTLSRANLKDGLFTPACRFAAADANRVIAQRYARMSPTNAQGQSTNKDVISKQYLTLADDLEKAAEKERLDYWGNRNDESTEAHSSVRSPHGAGPGGMPGNAEWDD